jgi:hypothetical protein
MQSAARASFLPVEMRNAALLALAEWNALPHLR